MAAAEELGGDAAEQLKRLADGAASDETYQELLARTLTIARDTAMRDQAESPEQGASELPGRLRHQS